MGSHKENIISVSFIVCLFVYLLYFLPIHIRLVFLSSRSTHSHSICTAQCTPIQMKWNNQHSHMISVVKRAMWAVNGNYMFSFILIPYSSSSSFISLKFWIKIWKRKTKTKNKSTLLSQNILTRNYYLCILFSFNLR